MGSLQVLKYAGLVNDLGLPDGPPTGSKMIPSGTSGTVYGTDGASIFCDLTAIGGDVVLTWPNSVTETLEQGSSVARRLRGEVVVVA